MLTGPPPKFHGTWDILGRVFSLSNLDEMLTVSPFPDLVSH